MKQRRARLLGTHAEDLAQRHLEAAGLQCRDRNVHCRGGELDLIMMDGDCLVFVEVRKRSRDDYGAAAESVTASKRRRLVGAARYYLHRHGAHERPCRFDVVTIDGRGNIAWLRDAFRADE